jgi:methyl-accepting chemotaxis protein
VENLKLRGKFFLLLLFPILGIIYFSTISIIEKSELKQNMTDYRFFADLAFKANDLTDEISAERGLSVFSLTGKLEDKNALKTQRQNTDLAIAALKSFLGSYNQAKGFSQNKVFGNMGNILAKLSSVNDTRNLADSGKISIDACIDYYTEINNSIMLILNSGSDSGRAELSNLLRAYYNLMQADENAGLERAYTLRLFSAEKTSREDLLFQINSFISTQNLYLNNFFSQATPSQKEYYYSRITDQLNRQSKTIRNNIISGKISFSPGDLWNLKTEIINRLNEVESFIEKDLYGKVAQYEDNASQALYTFILLTFLALIPAFLIIYQVIKEITTSIYKAGKIADNIASFDLSGDIVVRENQNNEFASLFRSFKKMSENLRNQIQDISKSVQILSSSSVEINTSIAQVAAGATEIAASVSETATVVEELKQTAQVASEKAKFVSDITQKSVQFSQTGEVAVGKMINGMEKMQEQMQFLSNSIIQLSEHNQAIGDIINSVNDLAEQSNLLAVNASIEAAKAGEYGKGFSVVAVEVRELSKQSKQATEQVRRILNDIQKSTNTVVMAIEQGSKTVDSSLQLSGDTGNSLQMLAKSIKDTAQAMMQIELSSKEQLVGSEQVRLAIDDIKNASNQNAQGIRQIEASLQDLKALGDLLKVLIDKYKL